ncbi:uncharacterized protein LOC119579028 [Penaeus monodon]|uniref:uncharacterized protein LOC119579028 n=1 Tax=Penaeus monodon TaxID=6687 RepID=UPI0018A739E5|nr:uncharacterized protein LOC119579028 [Penaeus monodon]
MPDLRLSSLLTVRGTRRHFQPSVWILLIVISFANGVYGGDGDASDPFGDAPPGGAVAEGRILGLDVGDENTNFQAGMWLLALVSLLATAIPAVFLDPSLGFRKRRKRHAAYEGHHDAEGDAGAAIFGEEWRRVLRMVQRARGSYGR